MTAMLGARLRVQEGEDVAAVAIEVARSVGATYVFMGTPSERRGFGRLGASSERSLLMRLLRGLPGVDLRVVADPSLRAIAVEAQAERAARIGRNGASLGVPAIAIVQGAAPDALRGLPPPDAIFIGGGASAPGMVERACDELAAGGRLVVNAVTLETQAACVDWRARWGGELTQIAIAHAEPVGRYSGWRAAMPVVQWRLVKP